MLCSLLPLKFAVQNQPCNKILTWSISVFALLLHKLTLFGITQPRPTWYTQHSSEPPRHRNSYAADARPRLSRLTLRSNRWYGALLGSQ